jgi:hypothetical protein
MIEQVERNKIKRKCFFGISQYGRIARLERMLGLKEENLKSYLSHYISREEDVLAESE